MTTEMSIFKNVEKAVANEFTLDIAKHYDWKPNISDDIKLQQGEVLFQIDGLNRVGQKINEIMIPYVVKAIHLGIHESIKNCKSINQLLVSLGIPKGTASGYVKIANICYNEYGDLYPMFSKFNYKSLQLLAQAKEEDRNYALEYLEDNLEPTSKEVADALKHIVVVDNEDELPIEENVKETPKKDTPKEESKETPKEESKDTPKEESKEKLSSNAHYQLTQLRAHIDSLTKEQIKKVIDDILALG